MNYSQISQFEEVLGSGIADLREWWKLIEICGFSHVGVFRNLFITFTFFILHW